MEEKVNITEELITGTRENFSMMLPGELLVCASDAGAADNIRANIAAIIGFGGGIRGALIVHSTKQAAINITNGLLGIKVVELDEDVRDALGEIANMIAGNLKVSFAKINKDVKLAIPTSILGDSFSLCGFGDAHRVMVPMSVDGASFGIELLYVDN